jgi:hypothetical protein
MIAKKVEICGDIRTKTVQMNRPKLLWSLFIALLLGTPVFTLSAASIPVPNFSFESPALPNGANNNGGNGDTTTITGWTISAAAGNTNAGVYHPAAGFSSTNPLPAPADGSQIAYLVPDAESTSSITTSASLGSVAVNMLYTLTVALGNRNDNLFFDSGEYTIDLLANGVSVAEASLAGSSIAHGTFTDLSATFISPASGPVIGQSLTIRLSASSGSPNNEGIFDNVRLTARLVPEPSTVSLIMIAGAALASRLKKKLK